jgi:hypothetical protein
MSIISNFAGKPKVVTAADIQNRLQAAQQELAAIEARHGDLALAAIGGADGAQTEFDAATAALTKARGTVATLSAAHKAAIERDEANLRRSRAALQKSQLAAVRSHLNARDAAADAIATAIAEMAKQWKLLLERSAKARNANPIGGKFPSGALCGVQELQTLVAYELHRACTDGNGGEVGGEELPGSLRFAEGWPPTAAPPLVEKLRAASLHVVAVLTGKIAE